MTSEIIVSKIKNLKETVEKPKTSSSTIFIPNLVEDINTDDLWLFFLKIAEPKSVKIDKKKKIAYV